MITQIRLLRNDDIFDRQLREILYSLISLQKEQKLFKKAYIHQSFVPNTFSAINNLGDKV